MARRPFSTSPSYLQAIRGFHRLHALTLAGEDDSPEADAIRDAMERPWYDLSEIEKKRLKGLSEDLYSISDPPSEPLRPNHEAVRQLNEPETKLKLDEVTEKIDAGEGDEALELLRQWSRTIDPANVSFFRGIIWEGAEDIATANLFFKHAASLRPQEYQEIYLDSLRRIDPDLAREAAGEVHDPEDVRTTSERRAI